MTISDTALNIWIIITVVLWTAGNSIGIFAKRKRLRDWGLALFLFGFLSYLCLASYNLLHNTNKPQTHGSNPCQLLTVK